MSGINTHLDTVQKDITNTKKEINNLLEKIDENNTNDLQNKFETVQKHLNDITIHFNETLVNIETLIENLSKQNKTEYESTISTLTSVHANLKELSETNSQKMSKELSDMQSSYIEKISLFENDVKESFGDVKEKLSETNTAISEKMDEQSKDLNDKLDTTNGNILDKLGTVIDKQGTDSKDLNEKIDTLNQKIDDSFTSVSNGKKLLASTLLTYRLTVAQDAKFEEIAKSIEELGNQRNANENAVYILNNSDNITADKILAGRAITKSEVVEENGSYTTKESVISGTATSDANAGAAQILKGYSGYVNGNKINGSMANNGAVSKTIGVGGSYTIPAGYHNGSGKVSFSQSAGTASITANTNRGTQTYNINANYYNKVTINQETLYTTAYNAGYSAGSGSSYNSGVAAGRGQAHVFTGEVWGDGGSDRMQSFIRTIPLGDIGLSNKTILCVAIIDGHCESRGGNTQVRTWIENGAIQIQWRDVDGGGRIGRTGYAKYSVFYLD